MRRSILWFLFSMCIIAAILPTTVKADENSNTNIWNTWGGIDWNFTVTDEIAGTGTLTIRPTTGTPGADPRRPGQSCEVGYWLEAVIYTPSGGASAIGGWPYDRTKVTELIIEEGVTHIGSFVAKDMPIQGEVVIPSTVTYIGQEAFQNSTIQVLTFAENSQLNCVAAGAFKNLQVKTVTLPASLTCLHHWAFVDCKELESVTFLSDNIAACGSGHLDYYGTVGAANGGGSSKQFFSYNFELQTVTFQNTNVRDSIMSDSDPRITVMTYDDCVVYTLDGLLAKAAAGDIVTLNKSASILNYTSSDPSKDFGYDTIVIPSGVTLVIPEGITLTNSGTIVNLGRIEGGGTLKNNRSIFAAENSITANIIGNTTFNPVYTVSYDLGGGILAEDNPYYLMEESTAFTLVNPTRTGYIFKGWSGTGLTGDNNQTVMVDANQLQNYTFTANWTANTYHVSFDANGGTGSMQTLNLTYGEEVLLPANTFVRTGQLFGGWNTAADGTGVDYSSGQNVSNLTAENGATITLYAQWHDKPSQTIVFDTSSRRVTYGDGRLAARAASATGAITYTSSDPTVATVDGDGVVTVLKAGETLITAIAAETAEYASSSVAYILRVSPKPLVVTANNQTAYMGDILPSLLYTADGFVGTDTFLSDPSCVTDADMSNAGIYDVIPHGAEAGNNYTITYVNGTLTVELPIYTVTYLVDGEIIATLEVKHGDDAAAPAIPAKLGHDQTAPIWDKDGKNITADTQINAVYAANQYTITFTDEKGIYKTLTYKHGEKVEMPAVPTKSGYTVAWETVISTASDNAIVKAIYNPDTGDAFDIRFQIVTMLTSTLALGILLAGHNKRKTHA